MRRDRATSAPAIAVGALVLTLVFPYGRFIAESAKSDTLGLIPLWAFQEHLLAGSTWATVAVAGGAFVALFLLIRARYAYVVPLVLLVAFVVLSRPVWTSDKGFVVAGEGCAPAGDRRLLRGPGSTTPSEDGARSSRSRPERRPLHRQMNEFFNRSVGQVLYTVEPTPGRRRRDARRQPERATAGDLPAAVARP